MKTLVLLYLSAFIWMIVSWLINVGALLKCDFQVPYKGEVIHAVGLFFPPAAVITVWFLDDK